MILIYTPIEKELNHYRQLFADACPDVSFVTEVAAQDAREIQQIICWGAPEGFFNRFSNLQTVFALGAGVDSLIARADLPEHVSIVRLLDAGMAAQMVEFVRFGVLYYQRQMLRYSQQQREKVWRKWAPTLAGDLHITVLGAGRMGSAVAQALASDGYSVSVWSQSEKSLAHVECVFGDSAFDSVLARSDVIVCLLPLTKHTNGLLNHARFSQMKKGVAIINAARGDIVDELALIEALTTEQVGFALLDVFQQEPLAASSKLWALPNVVLTPHVAAMTLRSEAVNQISANLRRLINGQALEGVVNRAVQY